MLLSKVYRNMKNNVKIMGSKKKLSASDCKILYNQKKNYKSVRVLTLLFEAFYQINIFQVTDFACSPSVFEGAFQLKFGKFIVISS